MGFDDGSNEDDQRGVCAYLQLVCDLTDLGHPSSCSYEDFGHGLNKASQHVQYGGSGEGPQKGRNGPAGGDVRYQHNSKSPLCRQPDSVPLCPVDPICMVGNDLSSMSGSMGNPTWPVRAQPMS